VDTNVDQRLMNYGDGLMSGSSSVFSPHHNTLPPCQCVPLLVLSTHTDRYDDSNNY
jgi:hypothetical protein